MNEEVFNLEVRKFLKRFGVTAQREIEKSVAAACPLHLGVISRIVWSGLYPTARGLPSHHRLTPHHG